MTMHHFDISDAERYGVDAAIILANLKFWLSKHRENQTNIHDGYYWTYNTAEEFSRLFPYWTSNKIQKLLKKMERDGIIITGRYNKKRYDKTKWYTLPEYTLQPNGWKESADSLEGTSQTAEPIPDLITDINADENITDIIKNDELCITDLDYDDYEQCHLITEAMIELKEEGYRLCVCKLREEEWDTCERLLREVYIEDHKDFLLTWLETYGSGFRKEPSLPNIVCEQINGVPWYQWCGTAMN